MVEVTQADRDAAAAWAKRNSRALQAANILRGGCDTAPIVQAFAAHRLAAEAAIEAWLLTYPSIIGLSEMAAWNTASAIARREHAGEG